MGTSLFDTGLSMYQARDRIHELAIRLQEQYDGQILAPAILA